MSLLLLIVLVILLIGAAPAWPYSRGWGYTPSILFTVLIVILIYFIINGRI